MANGTFLDTWAWRVVVAERNEERTRHLRTPPQHTPVRPPLEYRRGSQSDHVVNRTTLRSSTLHALWPTYTAASPWPRGEVAAGGSLMNRSLGLVSLIMRGQEGINLDLRLITGLFSATGQIPSLILNLALIACEIRRARARRWSPMILWNFEKFA